MPCFMLNANLGSRFASGLNEAVHLLGVFTAWALLDAAGHVHGVWANQTHGLGYVGGVEPTREDKGHTQRKLG